MLALQASCHFHVLEHFLALATSLVKPKTAAVRGLIFPVAARITLQREALIDFDLSDELSFLDHFNRI